jgi:V/A-type H+-transporting ATPase subunit I
MIALAVGAALITAGVVLNIANRLRRGDYAGGLLGRFGLVGIVFYWGALALAIKLAVAPGPVDGWLAAVLVVVPLLVLMLHEPLVALLTRREKLWEGGAAIGLMLGAVEAMETVVTYMANTFSFLRVAAFALSHAALSFTIFVLVDLVRDVPGGLLWSAMVFVLGTALIVGLEGLIVAIQILRLEYYEFFTKFFRGEGVRYDPFQIE